MKSKLLNPSPKTFAIIFNTGDKVVESLTNFARKNQLGASQFTAIGAFSEVALGFFVPDKKSYTKIILREQVEVLSMIGDITLKEGAPQLHAHVVVGRVDATAHGGHLIEAVVRPTLEVVLTESPEHLHRTFDPESGLALIDLEADKH